MIYVTAIG